MPNTRKARILVADDEPVIRKVVVASLTAAGYDVETASSGEEVVALADLRRPDLVVLDVEMPEWVVSTPVIASAPAESTSRRFCSSRAAAIR
jgi:CheY-like chemotaxis protein